MFLETQDDGAGVDTRQNEVGANFSMPNFMGDTN